MKKKKLIRNPDDWTAIAVLRTTRNAVNMARNPYERRITADHVVMDGLTALAYCESKGIDWRGKK